MYKIHLYDPSKEEEWLNCHLMSYYNSIYFDELLKSKPRYENPVIEIIATIERRIVAILDIEVEREPGELCSDENHCSGLISVVGVNPNHRRKGIGTKIIRRSQEILKNDYNIQRLEIWIRDDHGTSEWLLKNGFKPFDSYYQVLLDSDFFEKFNIDVPFEIYPIRFNGNIEEKMFKTLLKVHAPEKSLKIIGLEKFF